MGIYTISSAVDTGVTLTTTSAYLSPLTITSAGSVNDPAAAEGYGAVTGLGSLRTVTNYGKVTGGQYGIYLRDGGLVTNAGTVTGTTNGVKGENIYAGFSSTAKVNTNTSTLVNSGYIRSTSYAVQFEYGGNVNNSGTIIGASSGAGVDIRTLPGTVTNSGSITGGIDVELTNGGYVSNSSSGVLLTNSPNYGNGIELGSGDATVVNAGNISAGYAGIYDRGGDSIDIRNSGVIIGAKDTSNYGYSAGIWAYGVTGGVTIENSGLIESAQGAGGEAVTITSAALDLIIDSGAGFVGSVSAFAGDTNIIELTSGASAGSITGIGSQFTGFETIAIDAGASWTLGGDSSGLLNGIQIDRVTHLDTIDLTGTLATSDTYDAGTGVLTLFGADGEIGELHLTVADEVPGTTFAVTSDGHGGTDITTNAICYLRGTRLATAHGERLVEDIAVGDLVVTRNGGLQPVRWVGRQSFAHHQHGRHQHDRRNLPVRVRAGALGAGLPVRDLLVSPGHSMLVGGVLILARHLVNGVTVTQDTAPAGDIDYFQFELAVHDCLMAEGSWSESFADGPGLRGQFDNGDEFFAQHPGYVEPPKVLLCAPRPLEGEGLEAALRPVVALAGVGLAAGPLEGWIDAITSEMVAGWAIDTDHAELPMVLEIWAGGNLLGTSLACAYRADLEDAGKGNGQCAFFFALPPGTNARNLRVRRGGDGASLPLAAVCRDRLRAAA